MANCGKPTFGLTAALILLAAVTLQVAVGPEKSKGELAPEAELYWTLESALRQGQMDKARQIVEANAEVARRLRANLLFLQAEANLDPENAAPISPLLGKIVALLNSIAGELLQKLAGALEKVSDEPNFLPDHDSELAKALSDFIRALKAGDLDEQIRLLQTALGRCNSLGLELGELLCLYHLSVAERDKGDLISAFTHANQARNLIPRWNYAALLPKAFNNLGIIAYRLGLAETARQNFLNALEAAEKQGNKRMQGMILTNLSAVEIQSGNFRQAAEFLQQAFNFGKTAVRLNNLGTLRVHLRDYEDALLAFNEALELARRDNDLKRQVLIWSNIGGVYLLGGNVGQALSCLQRALDIARRTHDRFRIASAHLILGITYASMEEFEKAENHLSEFLNISRQLGNKLSEIEALCELGALHIRQGRLAEGINLLEKAIEMARETDHRPNQALALLYLGVALGKGGKLERALNVFEEALEIWRKLGDRWMQAWTWHSIGETSERLGEEETGKERERYLLKAVDAYWQALRLMEQVRREVSKGQMRALFAHSVSEPFYQLVDLLIQMNRVEEAFEVAERMRAQSLLELIRFASLLKREPLSGQIAPEYRALKRRIVELERELTAVLSAPKPSWEQIGKLERDLTAVREEFERQRDLWTLQQWKLLPIGRGQIAPGAWRKLQLPKDTAVLSYVVAKKRTWVFVLHRRGNGWQINCLEIPVPQRQLEEDITWLREGLVKHRPIGATLRRLHETLFTPVEKLLRGKYRRLIIIPDGPLFALPFQALQDDDGTYLVERFAIAYVPSLTTLWVLNSQSRAPRFVLASSQGQKRSLPLKGQENNQWFWTGLAVSKFEGNLEPLPFASEEVKSIASLLNKHKLLARVFIGNEATKGAASNALKKSKWVHFATHAILEPDRPLYSRLILKADQKHDGALRAFEVLDSGQVASEMVVLSACETGLGKVLRGEGLMGLVWVFAALGTKTLVVSQWQVNDLSAAQLMKAYYRHLLKGLPPAEALQKAQVELLNRSPFNHPYFWATFMVWGKGF